MASKLENSGLMAEACRAADLDSSVVVHEAVLKDSQFEANFEEVEYQVKGLQLVAEAEKLNYDPSLYLCRSRIRWQGLKDEETIKVQEESWNY